MTKISIRPLEQSDHADWKRLWTDYLIYYEASVSEEVYATTWKRLMDNGEFEPNGLIARFEGKAVGLVHFLYHRSCWSLVNNCYLQDLFADSAMRGKGVGTALIKAVQEEASNLGVKNVYWMTKEDNTQARSLYDKVATRTGFIEYDLL